MAPIPEPHKCTRSADRESARRERPSVCARRL